MKFNWKVALHYGLTALAALDGLVAFFGGHIPGVTVDPKVAFTAAAAVFIGGHLRKGA